MFRAMDTADEGTDLAALIAASGCEGDPVATEPIVERYGLTWG